MSAPDESCSFCEIIRAAREACIVHQDEVSMAFLDHRPVFKGHCLLVPRAHHETIGDLPADLVGPLFLSARLLARAVEKAMQAEGTLVALNNKVSQSVPHLHIHVVPRRRKDGLRGFFWPRLRYESTEAMLEVQARIRAALDELQLSRRER